MATARVDPSTEQHRLARIRLLRDQQHVDAVVERGIRAGKTSIWIATANLKDVHVEAPVGTRARARGSYISLFEELQAAALRHVDVRILHAGPPSRVLAQRIKAPRTQGVQLRRCPRVHLKMIAVDGTLLYLGSANFTGAGLGAKSPNRRNFEAGIITDDEWLLDEMQATFDALWKGKYCKGCQLRSECPKPLDEVPRERR